MTSQQREETIQQLCFWATCPIKVDMIAFLETFRQVKITGTESVEIGLLNVFGRNGDKISCLRESMICGLCPVYQKFNCGE